MKKIIAIALCLLALPVAYVVTGPYRTVNAIRNGLETNNTEALSENVEFPTLKQHLKDQMHTAVAESMDDDGDSSATETLASGFATMLIDKLVDSYVTPRGLAKMLANAGMPDEEGSDGEPGADAAKVFDHARYRYDSLNSFSVFIPIQSEEHDDELRLVLKRRGLSWKLCYIYLPEKMTEDPPQVRNQNPYGTRNFRRVSEAPPKPSNFLAYASG